MRKDGVQTLQNPNQYFSLDFINNDTIYKNKTLGQIYNVNDIINDKDVKYDPIKKEFYIETVYEIDAPPTTTTTTTTL